MLLKYFQGEATTVIDADPDLVFASLTDVARLPGWNQRITGVVQPPDRPLAAGVEWKVRMAVPPAKWVSRTEVIAYDPGARAFAHRSQSDDGNPTYVEWRWTVAAAEHGSLVRVAWEVHVMTFWRQFLFAKVRRPQLADEVPASLDALADHLAGRDAA